MTELHRRSRVTLEDVRNHRAEITEIADRFGAQNIRVFGSVARGQADGASDLDLLVDVLPGHGLLALSAFVDEVEERLHVVDPGRHGERTQATYPRAHCCRSSSGVRDDQERLRDLLEAADKLAGRVARGRQRFDSDEDLQLAMVRLIEIVGEACAHLSPDLRERHPGLPWRAAANMRNRVIHGYLDNDLGLVCTTAADEVPELAGAARTALDELTREQER